MSIVTYRNIATSISAQAGDGNAALFPQAIIKNSAGTTVATIDLISAGFGLYTGSWTPTVLGTYTATQIPYTDMAHTLISTSINYGVDTYQVIPEDIFIDVSIPQNMTSGSVTTKQYLFSCAIKNSTSVGIPADVLPEIKIIDSAGNILVPATTMVASVDAGVYYYVFVVAPLTSLSILAEVTTIVSGVTSVTTETAAIGEAGSVVTVDIGSARQIAYQVWQEVLPGVHDIVDTAGALVQVIDVTTNATDNMLANGPESLYNLMTAIDTVGVDGVAATVAAEAHIVSDISNQTAVITGPDGRNLTQVFDSQRGTDGALLSTDPRLDNLDALISSRSVVTEASIWNYNPRSLTVPVPVNASDVWDALTSTMVTAGSIGSLLVTNVDTTISSRSTFTLAQLTTALVPIAQENTVTSGNAGLTALLNTVNTNVLIDTGILNAIKPQTDLIISGVATQVQVNSQFTATNSLIGGVQATSNSIKVKTDIIPVDPATQSAVMAIPTNPLTASAPGVSLLPNLVLLDAAITTVLAAQPVGYALQSTLNSSTAAIQTDIAGVSGQVAALPQTAYFNTKFATVDTIQTNTVAMMGAGFNTNTDSLDAISNAQVPSATTAADVWTYASRTLTTYPPFATTTDVANSQTAIISGLTQYECMIGTSLSTGLTEQEVLAWLNVNGETVLTPTQAVLTISSETGLLWTATVNTPDSNGVFRSTLNVSGLYLPGNTYEIKVVITYNAASYSTMQAFATVS